MLRDSLFLGKFGEVREEIFRTNKLGRQRKTEDRPQTPGKIVSFRKSKYTHTIKVNEFAQIQKKLKTSWGARERQRQKTAL